MSDEIDTSAERVEWVAGMLEALDAYYGAEMLRALAAERDAERQRAEKAEAEKKTYESGWLEAEGVISDLQERAEKAEAEVERLRKALEKCARPDTWHVPCITCGPTIKEHGNYIARAALRQDEGGE